MRRNCAAGHKHKPGLNSPGYWRVSRAQTAVCLLHCMYYYCTYVHTIQYWLAQPGCPEHPEVPHPLIVSRLTHPRRSGRAVLASVPPCQGQEDVIPAGRGADWDRAACGPDASGHHHVPLDRGIRNCWPPCHTLSPSQGPPPPGSVSGRPVPRPPSPVLLHAQTWMGGPSATGRPWRP